MLRASLMSLLALGLVAQEPAKPAPAAPVAKPAQVAPAAPAPKPADKVVARVGGEPITEADFVAALRMMPQQEQMQILMIQGGREEFIKRMAESKLLAVKAKAMGLDKTPEFQRTLERTKDDLLAREFLTKEGEALQSQLKISDADVKAYYDTHLDKFKQPDLVSVRHILVAVKQDPKEKTGLTEAEAKKRIAMLQADLKKGAKFADLAKKYSDDPGSKDNGGLYADVDPSHWDPDFLKAVNAQPVGKIGAPVKTRYGYHLIRVEGRKPARTLSFEEAKAEAQQQATRERQGQVWEQLMAQLKKEIPFEILTPAPKAQPAAPAPQAKPEAAKDPKASAPGGAR
ncbi:MAG TPA: peptidylprolyl isomerase [Holophagaceae bacterium]